MRAVGSLFVALALVVIGLSVHAWGQSRGIEVAVKAAEGSVETVRLYSQAYAVIIGIDRYENLPPGSELSYAVRDAQGVAEVLERDYAFDGIVTIYNEDATREGILRLLSAELGNTSEDDSVFIFWAGHALTKKTARRGDIGYLVPYDGTFDEAEMSFKNISMTTIKEDISRSIPAKHMFFVVDACYSGLLVTRTLEPLAPTRSLAYLQDITGEDVRQVLAAGKADQQVLDGGPRGHSVFTGRFIEALEGATDFITATEISARISEQVFSDAAARGHAQTPQGGKLFGLGDYVFVHKERAPEAVTTVEAGESALDIEVWKALQESENPADFEMFLQTYPSSPMAAFARNRLEALQEVQTTESQPTQQPEETNQTTTDFAAIVPDEVEAGGRFVRAWLGAGGQKVTVEVAQALELERPGGVILNAIHPGGPADQAGLRIGDVITAVEGHGVADPKALQFRIATRPQGTTVRISYARDAQAGEAHATLRAPPEEPPRNTTALTGSHPLAGGTVANLSPALAVELGNSTAHRGVIVLEVSASSPARRLRLRPGDVVVRVNGRDIERVADLVEALDESEDSWRIAVRRGERLIEVTVRR